MKSETIMLTIALALAIALVGGLIVVPAMTDEADAGCNPKKGKTDFRMSEDYSYQMIKCNEDKPPKHNF